jgi:hypothetical protein
VPHKAGEKWALVDDDPDIPRLPYFERAMQKIHSFVDTKWPSKARPIGADRKDWDSPRYQLLNSIYNSDELDESDLQFTVAKLEGEWNGAAYGAAVRDGPVSSKDLERMVFANMHPPLESIAKSLDGGESYAIWGTKNLVDKFHAALAAADRSKWRGAYEDNGGI